RLTLIGALRDGLRWEEFVALYGRLILGWGRRDFGLQDSDAENLCQEVLIRVWKGIAGYDPSRGQFRGWLYVWTRNAFVKLQRARPRAKVTPTLGPGRPDQRGAAAWDHPWEAGQVDQALHALEEEGFGWDGLQEAAWRVRAAVQPTTWKAFLLFEFF